MAAKVIAVQAMRSALSMIGWIQPYAVTQPCSCPHCGETHLVSNPQGIEGVDVADETKPYGATLSAKLRKIGRKRVRVIIEVLG